jgi:hypothetical protein
MARATRSRNGRRGLRDVVAVSLTSQFDNGALGAWCAEHLPGARVLVAEVQAAAATTRPVRPIGRVNQQHWATVGQTLGQRLALLIQPAPPYDALLGAVSAGLVDRSWPDRVAALFPTHAQLPQPQRRRACQLRPCPTGWLDLAETQAPTPRHPTLRHGEQAATDFITRLLAYLATHTPPGTIATPGTETGLARVCWVLAGWENAYRTGGRLIRDLAVLGAAADGYSADNLRAVADRAVVSEHVTLARLVATSGTLKLLRTLAGHPPLGHSLGYAGPVLIPHWAAGELLLGTRRATRLLDVKTALHVRDPQQVARWVFQLLGYAWLDPTDRYRIRHVGLYLARHGMLLTWPLGYFTATLLGHAQSRTTATARREFLQLATRVMTLEGADPTWLSAQPSE